MLTLNKDENRKKEQKIVEIRATTKVKPVPKTKAVI